MADYMEFKIISKPSNLKEIVEELERAIAKQMLIIIIGKCEVYYKGRGESKLKEGERIIIIKQDGAFLVHRPTGYKPVNWQPDTSYIRVQLTNHGIEIIAFRKKSQETVKVVLDSINFVGYGKLVDTGKFVMYLDELEIRDMLYEHPEIIEDDIRFIEKEKKLDIGSIDLFGYDRDGTPVIVEIKRVTATREAVRQLHRYVEAYKRKYGVKPRGILVAPKFTASAEEALERLGLKKKEINIVKLWNMKKKSIEEGKGKSILEFLS